MLLTDEEIAKIIQTNLGDELEELREYDWMVCEEDRAVAKAQLKKVILWGNTYCKEQNKPQRECGHCWQALLEELDVLK